MINILRTFHSISFHFISFHYIPPTHQYTLNLRGNRAEQSEWNGAERNEMNGDARSISKVVHPSSPHHTSRFSSYIDNICHPTYTCLSLNP